jgi:hypothetical protein
VTWLGLAGTGGGGPAERAAVEGFCEGETDFEVDAEGKSIELCRGGGSSGCEGCLGWVEDGLRGGKGGIRAVEEGSSGAATELGLLRETNGFVFERERNGFPDFGGGAGEASEGD